MLQKTGPEILIYSPVALYLNVSFNTVNFHLLPPLSVNIFTNTSSCHDVKGFFVEYKGKPRVRQIVSGYTFLDHLHPVHVLIGDTCAY